jgi:hypothetical protein
MRRMIPLTCSLTLLLVGHSALAAEGVAALQLWGRYHANVTAYMPKPSPPVKEKVKWLPKVSLVFRLDAPAKDDIIQLQHFQGKAKWGPVQTCQIGHSGIIPRLGKGGAKLGHSLVVVDCLMDESLATTKAGKFSVTVSYKQTGLDKVHRNLATYNYEVKMHNGVWPGTAGPHKNFHVDHDFRIGEASIYVNSEGQVQFWTWFKYSRDTEKYILGTRLRCTVGDKELAIYEDPTRRTENSHDTYPRRDRNEKVTWGLWYFWTAQPDNMTGADFLAKNPGTYTCRLTQSGEIARVITFEVKDGKVVPPACQAVDAANRVPTEEQILVKMQLKKAGDLPFDKKAYSARGLYGHTWGTGCPP